MSWSWAGGAGGLELVKPLGNKLGRRRKAEVTLIEKARTHLWKPLLHEVAAGSMDIDEHDLDYLAQAHWHHFRYRLGEMERLDRKAKQVHLAATFDEEGRLITPERSFGHDTLVIAIGASPTTSAPQASRSTRLRSRRRCRRRASTGA